MVSLEASSRIVVVVYFSGVLAGDYRIGHLLMMAFFSKEINGEVVVK